MLDRVKVELPDLYALLGTAGMLCARFTKIKQSDGSIKIARGADATALAGIGHNIVVPAIITPGPGKAMRKGGPQGQLHLGLLSVDPDAQGQGHSRCLVAAVEDHCRNAGCSFLDITVVNMRGELFSFYAKLGFAAFDAVRFPVPERTRQPLLLVRMTKPLLAPAQMALLA